MSRLIIIAVFIFAAATALGAQAATEPPAEEVPAFIPRVIDTIPHDPDAFTQGFLIHEGRLFESTGRYGESTLREVDLATGEVLRSVAVPEAYFAEGLALVDDRLIQLTWKEGEALVYDLETFEQVETFTYEGEGWGLCYDGESLWMSDGSPYLFQRDPATFDLIDAVEVTYLGQPIPRLNELECVDGVVYANVWQSDFIVQIDPASGEIVGVIGAMALLTPDERTALQPGAVLNGIAYNPATETFFITGKLWSSMYEVEFVPYEG